jgi:hypothetical protein
LNFAKNDTKTAVELYELNIKISSAFNYPLEIFEVILRNSINTVLIKYYGEKWYEEEFLLERHKEKLKDVYKLLEKEKKDINLNNIISNVSFGFWVDFFHLKYKNTVANILINIFNCGLEQGFLYNKLCKVKNNIRNRIAHRENMIKYDIMNNYGSVLQLISFILFISLDNCTSSLLLSIISLLLIYLVSIKVILE